MNTPKSTPTLDGPSPQEWKLAYKAFEKHLKVTQLTQPP